MYVAVDANILIADPGLQSQRLRVLWTFLERTRSHLVLLPSVEAEVTAHFERHFATQAAAVENAIRQAMRQGVKALPTFAGVDSAQESLRSWAIQFADALQSVTVDRPSLDCTVLEEALRRATMRVAPCDASGKEMRDTIHWLSLLSFARNLASDEQLVFLSMNTKDFATSDGYTLRPELLLDIAASERNISFFNSVESFNKIHADRIAHITVEWVFQHLGTLPIEELLSEFLSTADPEPFLRIGDSDYSDYYELRETYGMHSISIELANVHVWRTNGGELELGIEFTADVEVEVEGSLTGRPPRYWHRSYDEEGDEDFPSSKMLMCYGELVGTVAARVSADDTIEAVSLEDLEVR